MEVGLVFNSEGSIFQGGSMGASLRAKKVCRMSLSRAGWRKNGVYSVF